MKKTIIIISILLTSAVCFSQAGQLKPDTLNLRIDTSYAKGILYWDFTKGPTTKIDSGYAITKTAPMVFVGADGKTARTDQETTWSQKIFILPSRKEIEAKNVISFNLKPK